MQHQFEEFSVTDLRHTLGEVWRVISSRRWYFVFPFCAVSALALLCSLWVPRQWAGSTVIKREPDPVFASMIGEAWTHPYNEIRQRMSKDLQDLAVIEKVLEEMDLPAGLERFANGELTPQSSNARHRLAEEVAGGLTVTSLEASPQRDVAVIGLRLADATHLSDILRRVRDEYIARARRKTVEVLNDVEQFFLAESERCRAQLSSVQKRMLEYELQYPGIEPEGTDRSRAEEATLVVERIQLERTIADLTDKQSKLTEEAKTLSEGSQQNLAAVEEILSREPNSRHAELQREIEKVTREIVDGRTLRFMTEQHPVIQRLRTKLGTLQEELTRTPREQYLAEKSGGGGSGEQATKAAAKKLEAQAAEIEAKLVSSRGRIKEIGEYLGKLEERRALAVEHRQDYLKLKQEAGRLDAELVNWTHNLGPIRRVLTVEDRDRTVHFTMVDDVKEITKPVLPNVRTVMIICFGVGLAAGAIVVVLTELLDRSYRTIRQLRSSLGITVIESTDEIMTRASARKRLMRRFVVVPTAAAAAIGAVLISATMAYLSVESPNSYELLRNSPQRAYRFMAGAK